MIVYLKGNSISVITHPVIATLDHPLFAFGGKRVKQQNTLFLRRGSTSVASSG
jgi:hypothetical protein